jgi:predicted transposase YbfD/YdcC
LPVAGCDEPKQTNEIGMALALLAGCELQGRDLTADALLTQRFLAEHIVGQGAHYHFSVKGNQPTLQAAIALHFERRGAPDYAEEPTLAHGRIECRRLGCTAALNDYLDFPQLGQCFLIERERIDKKTGTRSTEVALGITSRPPHQASPERLLKLNRGHWSIEAKHHKLDWNYDEDRSRIRTGHGPANVTRLRHFALSVLKSFQKPGQSIAAMMRHLNRRSRTVLDYLRLTANSGAPTGRPA